MNKRWVVAAIGIACVGLVIFAQVLKRPTPINLLLISVDTLRPDHLGSYGYRTAGTPSIDWLARQGVTFEDALCSVPLTLPSHASMLTGLSPLSHGIRDNANFKLADDFVTLAEVLRANQYSTGAAVGAFILDRRFGLNQGFASYDDDLSRGSHPSEFSYPERSADLVTASAIGWLKTAREPFFLFVHYYDPHAPYEPPQKFREPFSGSPYDGEIAFADQEIGRLLIYFRDKHLLERTLIAFVSDHGEGLGDHGEQTHGLLLYEATLKVPFIIRVPEKLRLAGKNIAGKRISQTVRLTDLFPTMLELLGLKQVGEVDGRSLVPLILGKGLPPVVSYFETLSSYFAYRWSPLRGVRFNQWKFILAPANELYDLRDDPRENKNLVVENKPKAEELKAALFDITKEEAEVKASAAKLGTKEARQLRALGYVSPSVASVPEITDLSLKDPKKMIRLIAEYLEPGSSAFDRGELDVALADFKKFVEADPMNPEGHLHLARVLLEMKDYDAAIRAYEKVLEVDSTNSGAYFYLGTIAQAVGDTDAALQLYNEALRLIPDSPEALANIGSLLLAQGATDSAMTLMQQALDTDPRNMVALVNLGLAYSSKGIYDQALQYFRRVLKVEPGNLKALSNSAGIFVNKGQIDSALFYFERARDAAPNDPRTLVNLGGAYRQKGLIDRASSCYEKAVDLEPKNVLALYGLAGVRAAQGKRDEAKTLIGRILAIDPNFKPARDAAARLGQ
jgi:arylsulfatase A-like enzyme/Tfp pilus assembly protein PilF